MEPTVTRGEEASVVTVAGEIDVDTAYPMFLAAAREAQDGIRRIAIDLSGVTFIDSIGLGMLVRSRDELRNDFDADVVLRRPSPQVSRMLELTALDDHFEIEKD